MANSARVAPLEAGAMWVRGTALYLSCNLSPERLSKLATNVDWLKALKALDTVKSIPGNLIAGADLAALIGGAVVPCSFWWVPRQTLRLYPDGTVIAITENCASGIYWQRCVPFENDVLTGPAATITTTITTTPYDGGGGDFADVPAAHWAADQIGRFAARGITTGCDTNTFCPERGVTRAEMAAFLIRALRESELTPATPTFADVPASHPQYGYVEALVSLGVTTGCGTNEQGQRIYCPDRGVTRAEMAVFITRAYP